MFPGISGDEADAEEDEAKDEDIDLNFEIDVEPNGANGANGEAKTKTVLER